LSQIQALKSGFMSGGPPAMIFAGAVVVAFLVGFFSLGGALFLLALGLLAAVCVDFFRWRRDEQPTQVPPSQAVPVSQAGSNQRSASPS
jgi:O-antigen/teichoic acid export membrane protein